MYESAFGHWQKPKDIPKATKNVSFEAGPSLEIQSYQTMTSFLLLILTSVYAQHRLEPSDGSIMHCAGQTNQDFTDTYGFTTYSKFLDKGTRPEVYMVYTRLDNSDFKSWFSTLESILEGYGTDQWVAVQLGLDFNYLCTDIVQG